MTRPPFRPRNPVKMIGPYVGFLSESSDYNKLGKDMYEAGYNAVSVFLSTALGPWISPWKKAPTGHFNFGQLNQKWIDKYTEMVDTLAFWRITVHNKFVDQFHELEYNPGDDPFRQGMGTGNNFDANALYSSITFAPLRWWWLKWDEVGSKFVNYKTIGVFGKGMEMWIDKVIDINKQILDSREYPDFRTSYAWANETLAEVDLSAEPIHAKNIRGDRDEVYNWIDKKWIEAGFETGHNIQGYFDYFCRVHGDPRTAYLPAMVEQQVSIAQRYEAKLEIHGIMGNQDIEKYKSGMWRGYKFNANRALFSTDGDLRMEADYPGLGHSIYHTDLKLDNKKGQMPLGNDFMAYWNHYWPKYKEYVK